MRSLAFRRLGLSILASGLLASCTAANSPGSLSVRGADYGDAPDGTATDYGDSAHAVAKLGHFPTRSSSSGARVLMADQLWLGGPPSLEEDIDDSSDPDGRPNTSSDADDGLISLLLDGAASPPRATLTLSIAKKTSGGAAYLNVLVDLNQDGRWSGDSGGNEPEWAIRNLEVAMNGSSERRIEQEFTYSHGGQVPRQSWMRVLLSEQRVADGWDGGGTFERGEVEDHLIEMESASSLLDIDCSNPATGSGAWTFDGQRTVGVRCRVSRLEAGSAQDVSFDLVRDTGGVRQTGVCGGARVDGGRADAKAHVGPFPVGTAAATLECLFEKDWPLPSRWSLEQHVPPTPSIPTERGVRLGHAGRLSVPFTFEKGTCAQSCTSDRSCGGDSSCTDHCCVPAWAPQCAALQAEDCGRCCAVSGGVHAPDCVRQACTR